MHARREGGRDWKREGREGGKNDGEERKCLQSDTRGKGKRERGTIAVRNAVRGRKED